MLSPYNFILQENTKPLTEGLILLIYYDTGLRPLSLDLEFSDANLINILSTWSNVEVLFQPWV